MSLFKKNDGKTEHVWVEERLSAYLDDELSPQERTAVEHHLARCQDCQWNLRTLRQTVLLTKELPTVPVPRVFTIPAPAQEPVRARQRSRGRQRGWGLGLLQGATALVALLLMFAVGGDFLLTGLAPGRSAAPAPIVMKEQAVVDSARTEVAEEEAPRAMRAASVAPTVESEASAAKAAPGANTYPYEEAQPTPSPESTEAPLMQAVPAEPEATEAPAAEPEASALGATQFESPLEATQEAAGGGTAADATTEQPLAGAPAAAPAPMATQAPAAVAQADTVTTSEPEAESGQAFTTSIAAEPAGAMPPGAPEGEEPTIVAAAPALDQQVNPERAGEQEQVQSAARDSLASGVRIAEIVLGAAFAVLAMATVTLMIRRRRTG